MKHLRYSAILCGLLFIAANAVSAAQLASAKVMSVTGTVTKLSADGSKSILKKGDILKEGDSLKTAFLGEADLVFSNGSELTLKSESSLTIEKLTQEAFTGDQSYEELQADPSKSQALLDLDYGRVRGHVKKLTPESRFDIQTPVGTAAIRGTTFEVSVATNEAGDVVISVKNIEGTIDVIDNTGAEPTVTRLEPGKVTEIVVSAEDFPEFVNKVKEAEEAAEEAANEADPEEVEEEVEEEAEEEGEEVVEEADPEEAEEAVEEADPEEAEEAVEEADPDPVPTPEPPKEVLIISPSGPAS